MQLIDKLLPIKNVYFPALVNSIIFFTISLIFFLFKPESLLLLLLAPFVFCFGSFLIFTYLIKSLRVFEPLTWFILGSGVYFGLGVIAGGLNSHSWTIHIFGDSKDYLLNVNLLNSTSVLIVLLVAMKVIGKDFLVRNIELIKIQKSKILIQIFPYLLIVCFVGVILGYIYFPYAENLVVRSLVNKASFFIPSVFLIGAYISKDLNSYQVTILVIMFLLQVTLGILSFNKLQILMPMMAIIIGLVAHKRSYKSYAFLLLTPIFIFWIINPLVSASRSHEIYVSNLISGQFKISDRVKIIANQLSKYYKKNNSNVLVPNNSNVLVPNNSTFFNKIRAIGVRLDVSTIQGWLINEYNAQRQGESMDDFFSVLIPRLIWPTKPIVTRRGNELNKLYYDQTISSVAPTYSAEAYWNYGAIGLISISIYLGLCFGWLSRLASKSIRGLEPAYLLVSYHAIFSAIFLESWIVSTYVGGFAVMIIFFFIIKFLLMTYRRLWDS